MPTRGYTNEKQRNGEKRLSICLVVLAKACSTITQKWSRAVQKKVKSFLFLYPLKWNIFTFQSSHRDKGQAHPDYTLTKYYARLMSRCVEVQSPLLESPESHHRFTYATVLILVKYAPNMRWGKCANTTRKATDLQPERMRSPERN